MLLIDKYAYTNKLVDYNPMVKFGFTVGALITAMVVANPYMNLAIFLLMAYLTVFVADIPLTRYLKILAIPGTFLLLSIATILLSISRENRFIWSIKFLNRYIGFSHYSLKKTIQTMARVLASISSTFFLVLTTPLNDLIKVFKKIKIPSAFIELMVLIYRFIFIFLGEMKDILVAQEIKFGYINLKNSYKSIALLIKCLFIRLLIKYEEMIISLETRLYQGEFKTGD